MLCNILILLYLFSLSENFGLGITKDGAAGRINIPHDPTCLGRLLSTKKSVFYGFALAKQTDSSAVWMLAILHRCAAYKPLNDKQIHGIPDARYFLNQKNKSTTSKSQCFGLEMIVAP
ncbi:hypothetical protein [Acetobacter ascendens]|uniref:Uncharacterized protein n=1 Tax=Acetobacter ascendens TaxID=481146 RepID=A0A1Y0V6P3_9PROT|nr:hypothetical protein [Acetobacter ascendens]ARW11569.1 hypothetical protein S101447_02531 [Acetobacter ascendens]RCL05256.1 hypothetical protein BBA71_10135 [Acetobacter pasteurianus]GCD75052.1 hypothetical protein NBRC3299_1344 [Acetobacter pasteurianus NBRC 3299]